MPDTRCFRIVEQDLDELRDRTQYQAFIDAYSNWIRNFAPRLDEVIAQISAAFADTKLGEGIGLFEANGLDDYESDEELRRLRGLDEKLDWKRISADDLSQCYCSPSFFDRQGFVFHLPAFLIAQLNDEHSYGFIDRLYRTEEHPEGWRTLLTSEQRKAIIATLELIREHPEYQPELDDIDAAVERYKGAPRMG